jgi:signal transduction histidine kinase
LLSGLVEASDRVEVLLTDLARVSADGPANGSTPEVVNVAALAETLRRRLKAIVLGRDIRPTVFHTRHAPSQIRIDAVLLDRILDNLLTNAAKYTERGSILVELDAAPGQLCVRISDTGRGIAAERLEDVFSGCAPDRSPAVGTSLGLGLSVVVRTLVQLHGRLEVMSRVGQGSTFWLYVPIEPSSDRGARGSGDESLAEMVRRVIKIREAR